MIDIAAALAHAKIELRNRGAGNHKTRCPRCSDTRKHKNDPCLSVTIADDGLTWRCHHCEWATPTAQDDPEYYRALHGRDDAPASRVRVQGHAREATPGKPAQKPGVLTDLAVAWFAKRGIGQATLERNQITVTTAWMPGPNCEVECVAFPFFRGGELVNVKYRDGKKHFRQEKGAEKVFYGLDTIRTAHGGSHEDIIIVEGEIDALSLQEAGLLDAYGILSVPDGAPGKVRDETPAPEDDTAFAYLWNCRDVIESARRVILATDADEPGRALEEELARRIGKEKCWRVAWPSANDAQIKDANEVLVDCGAAVVRECIEAARPYPIKSLFDAGQFEGNTVRLFREGRERGLSTGFRNLDQLMTIVPGMLSVVTGYPSSGKSEIVDAIAVNMATLHGWKFAMCSFENAPDEHIAKLAEKHLGIPFWEGMGAARMGEGDLRRAIAWLDERFFFIRAEDESPTIEWVLETARAAVLRHGVQGLVLDPYNEFEHKRPAGKTETEYISEMLGKVKRFAANHGVHVFFVAHPAKPDPKDAGNEPGLYSISGGAHWNNKADLGVVVHRAWLADGRRSPLTEVFVKKVRFKWVGAPGRINLTFDAATGRYEESEYG